jgi:hypothetical protein
MSRSAYTLNGIGREGFRDSTGLDGFVHQIPKRRKNDILDNAATQMKMAGDIIKPAAHKMKQS